MHPQESACSALIERYLFGACKACAVLRGSVGVGRKCNSTCTHGCCLLHAFGKDGKREFMKTARWKDVIERARMEGWKRASKKGGREDVEAQSRSSA